MSDKEFTVEIDLLVDEKVSVETDLEMTESTELDLDLTLTGGSSEHQKLTGRNLPDQHPIEAISGLEEALHGKVDIEAGKLLTSNDFTNEYKEKLDSVEKNAEVNIIEHIWVNGEPQEVLTDRVVDLYMPTTTKELNDTDNVVYRDNDQVIYGEKTFEANVNIGTSEDLKFLDLKGSEAISQNLKVDGDVSIGGSVEILGETSIDNNVIIEGDLNSNKTLTVEGTTNLKSDVTLDKKLSVTGETKLNNTLEVLGQTTLKDNVTAEKDLSVEGSLTVTGDLELNGGVIIDKDLTVKGTTTLESEVELKKSLTVDGVAALKDNVTLDKNLRIVGSSTLESQVDIKGVANITNNVNVVGDLNISGNISQKGENYETHAEQVYSTSDYITLRDGAVSSLLPEEYSGFEINLYDGTNTGRLVIDNTGTARVGDVGDEQPLLTREESSSLVDGGLLVWDAENSRAKTTQEYSKTSEFDGVAFSGDYADLLNVPTKLSDFTDDTDTNPIKKAQTLKDLTVTSSTLNLLSGATSNIQEQLNQLDEDLDTAQENLSKEISDTKTEIENTIQPKLDELDQEIDTKVNLDDMVEVDIDSIKSDITNLENTKQDNLTSANAGDGISIADGIISNTRVSAEWGNIQGDISTQTDLADNYQGIYTATIDLTDTTKYLDTTWYPVVGESLHIKRKNITKPILTRLTGNFNLGSAKPSWSTHQGGYTCVLDLLDVGAGWGNTPRVSHVLQDSTNFTTDNTKPPIRYSQMTNSNRPVFWLRGGGKYYLTTEYDAKWSIKTEAYTLSEQTVTPTTTCPALSLGTQLYAKSVNLTSKGNSTTPIYFDANGVAQPITSYSGNANTATKAIQDSNGKQINTTYAYKTIGSQGILDTPTGVTRLEMVGKQACGNGVIGGSNLISLHSNIAYKCYERKSATITCNYEDKVGNLGKYLCDGGFSGHHTAINPNTMFTGKPFVWEVVSPTQFEVSDVLRLHLHSHRLADPVNCTAFKIEAYIQDTLDNTKKWVTVYNYSGASVNIAQTGWGLYITGHSTSPHYSIFGVRLTISSSPDTVFRLSEIQLVTSRGTERVCDAIQCLSTDGGKIWGNLEVTGNLTNKTQPSGTNNTTVATTAFVQNAISNSSSNVDGKSITKTSDNKLQAVGVLDAQNTTNALKTWTGTRSQYDAIVTKDNNTIYHITDDTDVTLSLLEILYPVGAIYIGTMATCPLQVLGVGNWVLKASDRVLQGAGANSVGSTVEAGLPNIEGSFYSGAYNDTANGAFVRTSGGDRPNGNNATANLISFDASLSNPIYGNSTTVQPPAYIVNIWERIS